MEVLWRRRDGAEVLMASRYVGNLAVTPISLGT